MGEFSSIRLIRFRFVLSFQVRSLLGLFPFSLLDVVFLSLSSLQKTYTLKAQPMSLFLVEVQYFHGSWRREIIIKKVHVPCIQAQKLAEFSWAAAQGPISGYRQTLKQFFICFGQCMSWKVDYYVSNFEAESHTERWKERKVIDR